MFIISGEIRHLIRHLPVLLRKMSIRKLSGRLLKRSVKAVYQPTSTRSLSFNKIYEEHQLLQKTCRDFAESELKPIAKKMDKEHMFPADQIKKMGQLGLLAVNIPEKYGGAGHNTMGLAIAIEEIARGCAGTATMMSIHNSLYCNSILTHGTEQQKDNFLKPFARDALGCFALSEPDAGSDVSALSTTARLDADNYILNGTKSWVTMAPVGKAAIIFATVDKNLKHKGITAILVPLPYPGVTLGKLDDKLGIRAAPTCNVILDNVKVPKENVLGNIGEGFKIAMQQLDRGRVGIASQALGIGQAALELAVKYASERKQFGEPINKKQAVKMRLADMAIRLESARLVVWRAAVLCDEPERSTKESSMAKLVASEAATFVSHSAIQILGGMGYVSDTPAERHYRDARITEIYAGVNDVQKILIGELITKEYLG